MPLFFDTTGFNPFASFGKSSFDNDTASRQDYKDGERVQYLSSTSKEWVDATVLRFNSDGSYNLDVKPYAPADRIRKMPSAQSEILSDSLRPSSDGQMQRFPVGAKVEYYSDTVKQYINAVVVAYDAVNIKYQLDVKAQVEETRIRWRPNPPSIPQTPATEDRTVLQKYPVQAPASGFLLEQAAAESSGPVSPTTDLRLQQGSENAKINHAANNSNMRQQTNLGRMNERGMPNPREEPIRSPELHPSPGALNPPSRSRVSFSEVVSRSESSALGSEMPGGLCSRPETQRRVENYLANEEQIDKMRTNFATEDPNFLQVLEEMRDRESGSMAAALNTSAKHMELEKKLRDHEAIIEKQGVRLTNQEAQCAKLEEERVMLRERLVHAERERDRCVEMEEKLERFEREKFEADAESREAKDELRRTVNQLRSKCDNLERTNQELENKSEDQLRAITEKKAHCDKADAKVRELEAHVQRQFEEMQELEKLADRHRTEAQKGVSATAFDRMKTRVKDLLADKERLQQEKQETEDECEGLRWKLDDRGKLLNAAMEGLQAWKSTEGGLLREIHQTMERSGRVISAAS